MGAGIWSAEACVQSSVGTDPPGGSANPTQRAHVLLHNPDTVDADTSRAPAEVEAESVAYLVTGELGLDATAYTLPYVSDWSAGDTNLILATANRAITGARRILDQITPAADLADPTTEPTPSTTRPNPLAPDESTLSILDEISRPG